MEMEPNGLHSVPLVFKWMKPLHMNKWVSYPIKIQDTSEDETSTALHNEFIWKQLLGAFVTSCATELQLPSALESKVTD